MSENKLELEALVEGGKASGGPPIGPAIGPTGVPIKSVIDTINDKTKDFKGLKVPVKIIVDTVAKTFEIKISTPMASALMFKEAGVEGGAHKPHEEFVADLSFEQVKKIARMKMDSLNATSLKGAVKIILGTAMSSGVKCDGKKAKDAQKDIDEGKYDDQLKE